MIVRVTCPRCGDLAVDIREIRVRRTAQAPGGSFTFECSECRLPVSRRAVGRVAEMLLAAGAQVDPGPRPLCDADVVQLAADLESGDWLDRLLACPPHAV